MKLKKKWTFKSDFTSFSLKKNTLEFAKETFIYHQCEKLTSKRHEETYMECCAMFLFTLYITEAMND